AFEAAKLEGANLVRWRYQRYMHDYLGCVKAVDEAVGDLLNYLDKEKLAENTVVIYASDQGFYLGEHGWFDKRFVLEESLRTPCLVRWPGVTQAGLNSAALTSILDFAPTFLDAAGVPVPAGWAGKSLRPILQGKPPVDWRQSFYYHYYEYPAPHRVQPHEAVVTDRYKLVRYYHGKEEEWELLDRQLDPLEKQNLYADPKQAATITELKSELQRLRMVHGVPATTPPEAFGNTPSPKKK
ncbi:MAG: sulfatase/phosphatase domain-containing protein, partial [Gemmataceae bacterium]